MNKTKPELVYLNYADPLRVFAIIAVISLHASAVRVVHLPDIHTVAWWTSHSIDSLCRWAVPVFVMVSGALNLDLTKSYPLGHFYSKRFFRVIIPLLFWGSVYFLWSAKFYRMDVSWDFIKTSVWSGLTYNHLYFLFIIIGLYVVTPLLKFILRSSPVWLVWMTVFVLVYLTSSGLFFNHIPMNAMTRFLPYMMYFVMGYLLRRITPAKGLTLACGLGFLAVSLVVIVRTYFLADQYGREDYRAFVMYDHFNVFIILQSVFMLLFAQSVFFNGMKGFWGKIIKIVAPASFGVYLLHVILLDLFRGYTAAFDARFSFFIIALEVAVIYMVSVALSLGISKIPYARSVIGSS